jgi:ABC-type bacteriocin/lantibiotic exporter with double-glycine peptidase domain
VGKLRIMLRSDKLIDDAIVHHVCSGAEKLNIPNIGQIEVLREQLTKLSQVKATSKPEKMLLNVWQLITKPGNRLNSVFIAGIFLLFSAMLVALVVQIVILFVSISRNYERVSIVVLKS